jgi:hypothetical protein
MTYACYYNKVRTHRSLDKDAPVSRPVQRTGSIKSQPILGGLHHHYVRVEVFGTHSHSIFVSEDNFDPKDSLLFGSMLGHYTLANCTGLSVCRANRILDSLLRTLKRPRPRERAAWPKIRIFRRVIEAWPNGIEDEVAGEISARSKILRLSNARDLRLRMLAARLGNAG